MSLSKIVKQSMGIVVADVISINKQNHSVICETKPHQPPLIDIETAAKIQSDKIIEQAKLEALRLIEEARERASKLILDAESDRRKQAEIGYSDGKKMAYAKITETMNDLVMLHQQQVETISQSIQSAHLLAIDIASHILKQKVESDISISAEMALQNIQSAVKLNIRSIEISQQQSNLIELLEEYARVELVSAPLGHLVIKTDAGWIDYSVETQLKNVRRHFQSV